MTKRQLIDQIIAVNRSARPGFLARFDDEDLRDYLDHLMTARQPLPVARTHSHEKYFTAPQPTATAVLEAPEQDDLDAPSPDDADETRGERDALVPAFIYDQQYSPTVAEAHETTDYEEEPQTDDQDQDPDEDEDHQTGDENDGEHDDAIEDDAVAVGQYADASFADAETDEDMESWLF